MPTLRTLLALLVLTSACAADELRTLDNKTYTGTLVSVSDKEVGFKTSDGVIKVPLDNVIALDLQAIKGVPSGKAYVDIRLTDDTLLHCQSFAFQGKEVEITLLTNEKLKVPLSAVLYILRDAQNLKLKTAFEKVLADKVKRDRVVIFKADTELVNKLEGTLGEPNAAGKTIPFVLVGGSKAIDLGVDKVHGFVFYRQETGVGNPVCMVHDVTGNVLAVTKVAVSGNKVVLHTGIKGTTIEWDQAAIARFDYNMGKLAFLSDMNPSKVVEKSAIGLIVTHRKDVNLDGEPIVLDRQYAKGLSLHAYTELEYDLKGKFKKFTATLGIDPRVGAESEPLVTIEADGRVVFSQTITNKVVPVDLDVTRCNTLRIVVSSRNILDLHDHVTIANPKVSQ